MDTKVTYKVFEGKGFPVDETLLNNITFDNRELVKEMMESGYYIDGLDIARFLREEDATINLEKLELAASLAIIALEANSPDKDVTLKIRNLDEYYTIRGIKGNSAKEREERTFILSFIAAVSGEASVRDTLEIKYV